MDNHCENKSNSDDQKNEIGSLHNHFKDNIRILSSIGQFSYILKIRVEQYDVSLTLQLDESYPSKAPEIILTALRLSPDQISVVQQLLQSYSQTLLNKPMVLLIYSRLVEWLTEHNIQTFDSNSNSNNQRRNSLQMQTTSKTNQNHNKTDHIDENKKKPSMKTAEDVISRIEWDENLDKRHFRVGFVDRFIGLQEKPFCDFDFKVDLSTISDQHSNVLAIPKHRIQYFKYQNEIVWDKETRTDLVFGSTGNQQTIYDIIKKHENSIENNHLPELSNTQVDNDDDDDDDDGGETNLSPPRYLTLTDGAYKPNYFLSIPIVDSVLIEQSIAYRNRLLSFYPTYFSSRVNSFDPSHLHVTLLTLYIETPSQVEYCVSILKRLKEEIRYNCSYPEAIQLEFDGISTFHDKVVHIKCKQNQRLNNLRRLIVERFNEQQKQENLNEIYFAGNYYDFLPHITLIKYKRKFSSVCQNEENDICFGKQTITCLQLCSIGKNQHDKQKTNCILELDSN